MAVVAVLATIWGFAWAAVLQFTRWGRWAAVQRTWLTVVIGTGANLLLLVPLFEMGQWLAIAGVFALSSIGIIARSIHNEFNSDHSRLEQLFFDEEGERG
ncbi:MAG: hypothetical protein H6642_00080 [Caldilineaceae bacterium]|nr:hypothetical protein [Caldilineaceae bacterium]